VATVRLTGRDVNKLAKYLGLTVSAFMRDYTESGDEGMILRRSGAGCVFLSGNDCTVYDVRPDNCADFPHTVRGDGSFLSRMWDFADRACYCPIVYETLEALKRESGFRG
jgi:Fe-S-cluster containining protein